MLKCLSRVFVVLNMIFAGQTGVMAIDPTEYNFKLALVRRNYDEVGNTSPPTNHDIVLFS